MFQGEEISSTEESYQTPNRIHIKLEGDRAKSFLICDYVFPDETTADISDRIKELFNHEIADSDKQILFVENLPRI